MEDKVLRIAVGLRIGASLVQPHVWCHYGKQVDDKDTHALNCHRSHGRYPIHASQNAMVKRSLDFAKIPSQLEPNGVLRSDSKQPDGINLVPWKCRQSCVGCHMPKYLCTVSFGFGWC